MEIKIRHHLQQNAPISKMTKENCSPKRKDRRRRLSLDLIQKGQHTELTSEGTFANTRLRRNASASSSTDTSDGPITSASTLSSPLKTLCHRLQLTWHDLLQGVAIAIGLHFGLSILFQVTALGVIALFLESAPMDIRESQVVGEQLLMDCLKYHLFLATSYKYQFWVTTW